MKKKIIALVLGALMIISMVGCEKSETDIKNLDKDKNQQIDYEEKYLETLETICDFIKNADYDAEYDEIYMGIFESVLSSGDGALSKIGYVFRDVNKDNIPELLIGSFDKQEESYTNNDIYSIYTIVNDNVEFVLGGRSRSMYSLKDDGKLFYMGSGGAAYSMFGIYHMAENGEVVCEDCYFTYPDDNDYSKIELYHNKAGEFQRENSEKLDITYDDFWKLQEEFAKDTAKITATSFESFVE